PKLFNVRWDAPNGFLISDLVEDGFITFDDHCSLPDKEQSHNFQITDNRLYTKSSLKDLQGRSVAVVVQAVTSQRIIVINVDIVGNSTPHFSAHTYITKIRSDASSEMPLTFDPNITIVNAINSSDLYISVISNSSNLPFKLVDKIKENTHYAELYLSRRLKKSDGNLQSFYISVFDKRNLIRLTVARVDVFIEQISTTEPKFDRPKYLKEVARLPPHVTVLRVKAK
ncbi:unnamed protein product, partial [Thelazia callipaeda]|uniref:Cadherin domain-containing protein n=1 Tax=Thelazia callipaeda TaxID=103827 RepID=A0A0N5D8Y2_THECL